MIKTVSTYSDPLCGRLELTANDLKLFQTKEMVRLRGVSLSAVFPGVTPTGNFDTRFGHSVGVYHLAKIVGRTSDFLEIALDLKFAGLVHDAGTPPFSHLSENVMRRAYGLNHEEVAAELLGNSDLGSEIKLQGGDLDKISRYILGKELPSSALINGEMDSDNLDNILRYATGIGVSLSDAYIPGDIAKSFCLHDGKLHLKEECESQIQKWENCRKEVYRFIYSIENMAPGSMIFQALDLAYQDDKISKAFFSFTDSQAIDHLMNNCGQRVAGLLGQALNWHFYHQVFSLSTAEPSPTLEDQAKNLESRTLLGERLRQLLNTEPENICVYIGKGKGFKQIDIPLISQLMTVRPYISDILAPSWMVQVYLHPSIATEANSALVEEYINDFLK